MSRDEKRRDSDNLFSISDRNRGVVLSPHYSESSLHLDIDIDREKDERPLLHFTGRSKHPQSLIVCLQNEVSGIVKVIVRSNEKLWDAISTARMNVIITTAILLNSVGDKQTNKQTLGLRSSPAQIAVRHGIASRFARWGNSGRQAGIMC
jgi:hypothetical protein